MRPERFDKAYFETWYENDDTRTFQKEYTPKIVRFVMSYVDYLGEEVNSVLDVGAGLGYWRDAIEEHYPGVSYVGVDISEYACRTFGWRTCNIARSPPDEAADLVVCQSVLQYLDDRDCRLAIRNLAAIRHKLLFLEALTPYDYAHSVLQDRTDSDTYLRPARWYLQRLRPHYRSLGGGLFVRRRQVVYAYELWYGKI